jgi:simple sugar transport system permease protein
MLVAMLVGAVWSLIPALLKAYHGVNEIVTTLMMSFLGISLANVLIKLPFDDPGTTVPQTMTLAIDDRLPRLFGSTINVGVAIGVVVILFIHWLMTRTAFGLRLQVVGANPRAAVHAGLPLGGLMVAVFALSAGLAGLAGSVEILGVWGNVRADWNPAYGLTIIPLVFLARFNGIAVIGFTFFFAVLSIGGETASRKAGLPNYFILVLVALMLIFLGLTEWLSHRRRMARQS